jgi:hypothetical protein
MQSRRGARTNDLNWLRTASSSSRRALASRSDLDCSVGRARVSSNSTEGEREGVNGDGKDLFVGQEVDLFAVEASKLVGHL